jgi:hypothetical protein
MPSNTPKTFTFSVSSSGFSPTQLMQVEQGDTIVFQPSGTGAPTSVTVAAVDGESAATDLFGDPSVPVPSQPGQQKVLTDHGLYQLTAGGHTATVKVKGSREIIKDDPIKK